MSLEATPSQAQQQLSRSQPIHVTGDLTPTSSTEVVEQANSQVPAIMPTLREMLTAPSLPEEKPGLAWEFYKYAISETFPGSSRAPKRRKSGPEGYHRGMFEVVKDRPEKLPLLTPAPELPAELPELTPAPVGRKKTSFSCNFCYKPYKTSKTLGKHQRECYLNPNRSIFECQVCFKTFKPSSRTFHMKTHATALKAGLEAEKEPESCSSIELK